MAGSPPPAAPNGMGHFTPEFKFTFVNHDGDAVTKILLYYEIMMVIETRGARFMNTV